MDKKYFYRGAIFFVSLLAAAGLAWHNIYAHCDTLDGPVVKDARTALQTRDVTPVLKWVKKESEAEIRAAFDAALAARGEAPADVQEADMKFFQTLVRVHRAGEG